MTRPPEIRPLVWESYARGRPALHLASARLLGAENQCLPQRRPDARRLGESTVLGWQRLRRAGLVVTEPYVQWSGSVVCDDPLAVESFDAPAEARLEKRRRSLRGTDEKGPLGRNSRASVLPEPRA